MTQRKKTALVICPGRGVYNASELGYLRTHHSDKLEFISNFDKQRSALNMLGILELDGRDSFSQSMFTRGDNASGLIYICSLADFLSIDRDKFDIVAVIGNSMGWYTALACGGAVSPEDGFRVVNTMGTIMHEQALGGQIVYPFVDENWQEIPEAKHELLTLVETINDLHVSIWFGGMIVLAGTEKALANVESKLERLQNRFPMRLPNHGAFHSSLMAANSAAGRKALLETIFQQPTIPMIDGRGKIWMPKACDRVALWDYTLGSQVTETYDFTRSVQTGLREFAPDCLIVLGPGNALGGATAQSILMIDWQALSTKTHFIERQADDPYMLAMGHSDQRSLVVLNNQA